MAEQGFTSLLQDDNDIRFRLKMLNVDQQSQILDICLLCQCEQVEHTQSSSASKLSAAELKIYHQLEQLDCQNDVLNKHIFFHALQYATHMFSLSSIVCELQLKYGDTEISVNGTISKDRTRNCKDLLQFSFDDENSMQARMILQLVKICKMKMDVGQNEKQATSLQVAAQKWSEEFAADFAAKFDANKNT